VPLLTTMMSPALAALSADWIVLYVLPGPTVIVAAADAEIGKASALEMISATANRAANILRFMVPPPLFLLNTSTRGTKQAIACS